MVINIHKKLFVFFLLINSFVSLQICSYPKSDNTAKQPEGYITNPVKTSYGVVFTDEYNSTVYLTNNGTTQKLFSAPGCGRYLSVSPSGDMLGFKLIDATTELQAPAVYDLKTKSITKLESFSKKAGQVTFANDGTIAYSLGQNVILVKDGQKRSIDLGVYSNRTPISPDASKIIYRDNADQLWMLDIQTLSKSIITDQKDGYANAVWSPDSKSIAYTTNGIKIYTTDISANKTYYIGEGESPAWSNDSKQIAFFKKEIDFQKAKLINSDIYVAGSKGEYVTNITNTTDVNEMDPQFDSESNSIIYQTYEKREVRSISLSAALAKTSANSTIVKADSPLQVERFEKERALAKPASDVKLPDYVHIHQVLDTRDSGEWANEGEGYSCCGATSCMQALASYGILPPKPFTTYGHTSNFGLYISDAYTYNGFTYSGFSGWPSGIHGYMWNGSGSPYSNAASFLKKHGVSSVQTDNVKISTFTTEISASYPYIVCSTGLTAAHIVMIVGLYDSTGHTMYVNDPYGNKNAGNYGGILNGKNAIYDWSDVNTGHEKITPVAWGITARCNPNLAPEISSVWPTNNADSIRSCDTISVFFNNQMDTATVVKAFSITPAISGRFFWSADSFTLYFKPTGIFDKLTTYTIKIDSSAKNFFQKSLGKVYSFSFKTRNRDKLNIVDSYPAQNGTKVSTTVQFRVKFDAPVLFAGLSGKVELFNTKSSTHLALANVKVTSLNGKGYLNFEPAKELDKNSQYYIKINGKASDVESISLYDTAYIYFQTTSDQYQSGTVIDSLGKIDNWKIQTQGSLASGIDTVNTTIALATDKKVGSSTSSAKVNYVFKGSNGILQINDANKPVIDGATTTQFGVWVYGDYSFNILKYTFNVGTTECDVVVDTINWTGWRLERISLSNITCATTGTKTFTGIQVQQTSAGASTGTIYFDDVQNNVLVTAVNNDKSNTSVKDFSLGQNYPNPFNPSTSIQFAIKTACKVSLKVFDVLGREVAVLVNEDKAAGKYSVNFSKPLASGVYYYTLKAGSYTDTKKMIIMK